jgi:methanethiol S-methyltransferase
MALTYSQTAHASRIARHAGAIYAWTGLVVMWAFWVSFVVFLANPRWAARQWPLPTVDGAADALHPAIAAVIDLALISLFGLQHSLMARPWFKSAVMGRLPDAFQRCTYVHAANIALFSLILFWQPVPIVVYSATSPLRELFWAAFAAGWVILLLGALSFGIRDLLGIRQMQAWMHGNQAPAPRLKTGLLYRWLRHPMYAGVLLAVWATPRMTVGHLLLAAGMTLYVLIALRYEERDLVARFGNTYARWRTQ